MRIKKRGNYSLVFTEGSWIRYFSSVSVSVSDFFTIIFNVSILWYIFFQINLPSQCWFERNAKWQYILPIRILFFWTRMLNFKYLRHDHIYERHKSQYIIQATSEYLLLYSVGCRYCVPRRIEDFYLNSWRVAFIW